MPVAIDAIRKEHVTMARILGLLEDQIDLFERAERPDYELIKEIVEYFRTFPDLYHHPKENLIYRKMVKSAGGEEMQFGDLEAQHEDVAVRLDLFARAVVNFMLEVEVRRDAFVGVARDFINGERKHMAGEESHFLPAALEALTDDEWVEIDRRVENISDPLETSAGIAKFSILVRRMSGLPAR